LSAPKRFLDDKSDDVLVCIQDMSRDKVYHNPVY